MEEGTLVLFAIPDKEKEKNLFEIATPNLGGFIITHDFDGLFHCLYHI